MTVHPKQVRAGGTKLVSIAATPAIISEFQADAVELEERVPPRVARATLYGVTALMSAAVLWASVSSIDEVVVAPGKLITTKPTIVVQPLETSIVRSINVAVGDVVHAGQTLATLDPTFTQADVDQQREKFAALDAQVKRLAAELGGIDYSIVAGPTPDEQLQLRLFGQRRAYFMAQLQNFDQQIAGQDSEIAASHDQETILLKRRDTLTRIEGARETLYRHETGSLLNYLTSKDARLDVDASLVELRGKTVEAGHALAKLKADRQAFVEDFKRAAMEELVDARGKRDAAAEDLKKMELRRAHVALTAPSDAVVLDLAPRSIGSVLREAEPVVTLVPLNVPLEAEVSVNARDVGRVSAGDSVRIKLDPYPFQKFGTASGTIRTISRDAFPADQKGEGKGPATPSVFHARVGLDNGGRLEGHSSQAVRLLPGMAVTAEIKVGRRRVISYFLYPLLRGLDTSIREP
ncbi:MAG: HlyD family type I secretion periplasmic adaptor subunit [Pararhizobium sp.]